jgi:RHH-type rel operon transcriptional repressor/antitoxin RelB
MPKTPTSLRLDPEVEQRLSDLVERTGRSKTYYITEAVRLHLEDLEDTYLAEERYRLHLESGERGTPLEEVMREYGVSD